MDLHFEILQKTPWWVYLIFIILVLTGLRSTKKRTITVRQLFFLPFIFMVLNLYWLNERLEGHLFHLIYWFIGLTIGGYWGWMLVRKWEIQVHHHDTISIPASWSTLIFIILFFLIRYFFVFNYEMHPEAEAHLFAADALSSGVMTGIFIGRALHLFTKYHRIA